YVASSLCSASYIVVLQLRLPRFGSPRRSLPCRQITAHKSYQAREGAALVKPRLTCRFEESIRKTASRRTASTEGRARSAPGRTCFLGRKYYRPRCRTARGSRC